MAELSVPHDAMAAGVGDGLVVAAGSAIAEVWLILRPDAMLPLSFLIVL